MTKLSKHNHGTILPFISTNEVQNCFDIIFGDNSKYHCDDSEKTLFQKKVEDLDSDYETDTDEIEIKQEKDQVLIEKEIQIHLSTETLDSKHEIFKNQIYNIDHLGTLIVTEDDESSKKLCQSLLKYDYSMVNDHITG